MIIKDLKTILDILEQESDRGVVLITSAFLENELTTHIKKRLLPNIDKKDKLLHEADFNFKINLAFRIGILEKVEVKVFHQLRSLRNICAHEVAEQNFSKDHFKHRIQNIIELTPEIWNSLLEASYQAGLEKDNIKSIKDYVERVGWRKSFEIYFGLLILIKNSQNSRIKQILPIAKI